MRSLAVLFISLTCALFVSCEPIRTALNEDEIKTSQQLEGDINRYDTEMKNTATLYLEDGAEGLGDKIAFTADDTTSGKRSPRQVVITASLPYTIYPYAYYPSVYTAARVYYYGSSIFPFLGI